jgi:hypothetical protein
MGKTHWSGASAGDDRAMGGAAEEMHNIAMAGETDLITVFDDFNDIIPAFTLGEADTADANVNPWFDAGWIINDIGIPAADSISMNDPVGGQLPYNSCLRFVPGTTGDTGGNAQLDLVNATVASEDDWTTTLPSHTRNFPHIWIDETAAGAATLDNTTLVFACRIGLRADTTTTGAGAWDGKCFIGWSEAGVQPMMTAATGALITGAGEGPKIGFHIPEDGSIDGISQRTEDTAYAEGTNFTQLVPAGGVDGTVANGLETAGDTSWFDLALRMHITNMSDDDANGSTSFYWRKVNQNASAAPGSAGARLNPWQRHQTVLSNQTPNNDVALVPTIEVIVGPTAGVDCEVFIDWWLFGKSRTSRLSK